MNSKCKCCQLCGCLDVDRDNVVLLHTHLVLGAPGRHGLQSILRCDDSKAPRDVLASNSYGYLHRVLGMSHT